MKLYEIDEQILNCCDLETGEIINEQRLQDLQMERGRKIENIACWIKNLLAEAEALKAEKSKLDERQKAASNKAESLKKYLASYLCGEKFETPRVQIGWRKSEQVNVLDINKIDDDYLVYKEPTVNKTKIKQYLKAGIALEGVELVTNNNIQIK